MKVQNWTDWDFIHNSECFGGGGRKGVKVRKHFGLSLNNVSKILIGAFTVIKP